MKYSNVSLSFLLRVLIIAELMQIALFGTSYLDLVFVYALGSFRRKVLSGLEYEEIARSQGELLPTLPFPLHCT
jgi:hypothetical protein